ncbi:pantetheine-phosphate adenylyltransferase [Parasporobacterium paucivorans]|uniref:Phosphopantetheine adenylyltransferase n=1 Tax=Parasporobacterium paucivorans DSM 15970 TaxID=1122934 RepID=A0A1M6F6D4_9FIRM|nr:pantetheine-phosphate adenylyltransferase [Parasporobacterium paucivorans]SHI93240.1 Phosphopantetheine adenylyltransferase [Parasporobacterium paucivorans DSM 15970]
MIRAIYPGSFDPVTYGHLDVIERAAKIFDEIIVAVLINRLKTPLFSAEERVKMLIDATTHLPNVTVRSFEGFSVDFAKEMGAKAVVRGLRAVTDFEYELMLSQTNRVINSEIDTVFLTTSLEYAYLSSSTVKEVAMFGGKIEKFVPPAVAEMVYRKLEDGQEFSKV